YVRRRRRMARALLLAVLVVAAGIPSRVGVHAAPQPAAVDISPEPLPPIDALMAETESRTPTEQKVDSQLIYELKMRAGRPLAIGVQTLETDVPYAPDGHPIVDVKADVTPALL